jgi:hypothetical protein
MNAVGGRWNADRESEGRIMEVRELPLSLVQASGHRKLRESTVKAIAASVEQVGLLNPITVVADKIVFGGVVQDGYRTIAGDHRLQAFHDLGRDAIPARIVDLADALTSELATIDENLCRAELGAAERAVETKRRKAVYESLHPETKHGAVGNGREKSPQVEDSTPADSFAESTAKATGRSRQSVERDAHRGAAICDEAMALIEGTRLDKGTFLDRLAKCGLPPDEQIAQVRDALSALADKESADELKHEADERAQAQREAREDACVRACQLLYEKLTTREWSALIRLMDDAGGSLTTRQMRDWEPAQRAA